MNPPNGTEIHAHSSIPDKKRLCSNRIEMIVLLLSNEDSLAQGNQEALAVKIAFVAAVHCIHDLQKHQIAEDDLPVSKLLGAVLQASGLLEGQAPGFVAIEWDPQTCILLIQSS